MRYNPEFVCPRTFFVSQHNIGLNGRKLAIIFILQLINNKYNFALKRPNGEARWHTGMSSLSGFKGSDSNLFIKTKIYQIRNNAQCLRFKIYTLLLVYQGSWVLFICNLAPRDLSVYETINAVMRFSCDC